MSEYVETLNRWGENFWGFAGPMLWQSSLLIAVVFVLDWVFARRIRASIRYALWMAVLVKLLLPPALALPTGVTWWLWRTHPAVEPPLIKHYTVSFDNTLPDAVTPTVPIVLPPPKLNNDAWVLLAATVTAVVFLSYLVFRWLRVAGKVHRAATAPAELSSLLDEARQLAGLRRLPRLKLIDEAQSPAVYGLFLPVILLPRTLANQLSVRQLRAVLLHEAMHLRRGDVWANCAQTLLQIAYWWHPLLWLANARIRRVREEAVDDAVMLALRDGADAYAPTLLEVAKYAFRRPLASLGLVGILESRSALRQRVERLMDFRPPRKTGITFLSACGIFAFCAVALPMGQGPTAGDSFSDDSGSDETTMTLHVNPDVFIRNIKARASWTMEPNTNDYGSILLDILESEGIDCVPPHGLSFNTKTGEIKTQNAPEQLEIFRRVIEELNRPDGKYTLSLTNRPVRKDIWIEGEFFWMTPDKFKKTVAGATYHRGRNDAAPCWTADPMQLEEINQRIESMGLRPAQRVRIQTSQGGTAELYVHDATNAFRLETDPYVYDTNIVLAFKAKSISTLTEGATTVTNRCEVYSKPTVDDDGGVIVRAPNPNGPSNLVVVLNVKTISSGRATALDRTPGRDYTGITNNLVAGPSRDIDVAYNDSDRKALLGKLNSIHLDVSYENEPLSQVLSDLAKRSGDGIHFLFNANINPTVIDPATGVRTMEVDSGSRIDPTTGLPIKADMSPRVADCSRINIKLTLQNAKLQDVLNAICLASDQPIKYSVEDYGVVFAAKNTNAFYEMRTFRVDPNTFYSNLRDNIAKLGVNLDPPKSVFYNDQLRVLFVYATPDDLDIIGKAVEVLVHNPPMLHIKARFIEVPQKFLSSAVTKSLFPGLTNGAILPSAQFRLFLREVESQNGSEELAEPEVTTIPGRQTEMRATRLQEVVTNYIAKPNPDDPSGLAISPQTAQIETGPILDVFPTAFADGQSISLNAMADLIQFFGYASPQGLPISYATNSAGQKVPLPTSLPVFQVCEAQGVNTVFYDGQTLVLFPKAVRSLIFDPDKKRQEIITRFIQQAEKDPKVEYGDKALLVLVTATLIDAAGNRIHSEDQMPFAQVGAPPQSP